MLSIPIFVGLVSCFKLFFFNSTFRFITLVCHKMHNSCWHCIHCVDICKCRSHYWTKEIIIHVLCSLFSDQMPFYAHLNAFIKNAASVFGHFSTFCCHFWRFVRFVGFVGFACVVGSLANDVRVLVLKWLS